MLELDGSNARHRTGYLVVGHGTRSRSGLEQVRTVFSQMQSLDGADSLKGHPAELAFLELAEPDIPTAVEQLHRVGVERIVVVPVLLFTAGHAQRDIPEAVELAARRLGIVVERQCSALCLDSAIVELSAERFLQAILHQTDLQSDCGRIQNEVALALIGRGSSSDDATAAMLQFAELRSRATACNWSSVGFIHAQRPTVDEALDGLAATGLPWLVVQPHLLFDGELVEELRREVEYRQSFSTSQKWILADTLGAGVQTGDTRLAATLCKLALRPPAPTGSVDSVCPRCNSSARWCQIQYTNDRATHPPASSRS